MRACVCMSVCVCVFFKNTPTRTNPTRRFSLYQLIETVIVELAQGLMLVPFVLRFLIRHMTINSSRLQFRLMGGQSLGWCIRPATDQADFMVKVSTGIIATLGVSLKYDMVQFFLISWILLRLKYSIYQYIGVCICFCVI